MQDKVETYSDMILALPGETYNSFMDGMNQIISNGQHNRIQFNNLSILPNAEMGNPKYQRKFGLVDVKSKIINMHGSMDETEDESIQELQQVVIATDSMPKEDWVKVRSICWMTAFLHFDKILQIPIILLHGQTGISYSDIFSAFMDETHTKKYPIINEIREIFVNRAVEMQNGGPEFHHSKGWLNIWWPDDEYVFIKLAKEKKIANFYIQSLALLSDIVLIYKKSIDIESLREATLLNHALLKMPFHPTDISITLHYDILKFYKDYLINNQDPLKQVVVKHNIERSKEVYNTWEEWMKNVVWYGNKKGAYLYGNWKKEYQLSGHY